MQNRAEIRKPQRSVSGSRRRVTAETLRNWRPLHAIQPPGVDPFDDVEGEHPRP